MLQNATWTQRFATFCNLGATYRLATSRPHRFDLPEVI
jgi:hypothetical protein